MSAAVMFSDIVCKPRASGDDPAERADPDIPLM